MVARPLDTILIAYDSFLNETSVATDALDRIKQCAPDANLVTIREQKEWDQKKGEIGDRVNVIFSLRPARWFGDMPNLKWAQQGGAGANWLSQEKAFAASDVVLTNASGVHAIPISEHILALMFALSRAIGFSVRSQIQGTWDRRARTQEIDGATMGLIGVGAIGEKTAEKAKGLNMRVLGLRRHPERSSPFVDTMYGPDGLNEMLSQADWVVVTAPQTPETSGMIDEAAFKAMKQTASVINIGRGAVIQEAVLIRALQEGWIAGAGLDVFEKEPLPSDSALWEMKNVIITAHYAGSTPRYMERLLDIFIENLSRYQSGDTLVNVVDKELGY